MKLFTFSTHRARRGFTLVELLVAMSVLGLMLVSLATALNFVSATWSSGIGNVDNFNKARVMLSLMDRDIQLMVMRRDLAAFVNSTGSGPACAFYSNVPAYTGAAATMDTRAISLLQYQLVQSASSSVLQRLSYGSDYLSSGGITPTIGNTTSLPQLGSTGSPNANIQTETVASGVVAFQWQFIDGSGTIQTPSTASNAFVYTFSNPIPTTNYRSVLVSMVVMDNAAYTLATRLQDLNTVAGCFPTTAPTGGQSYSQAWNSALNTSTSTFNTGTVPLAIRNGVGVFERNIPLPITTPSS